MKTRTLAAVVAGLMLNLAEFDAQAVDVRSIRSCGAWIKDQQEGNIPGEAANRFWLLGFLSGFAVGANKDLLRGTDNDSIQLWVDNYCRANPLDDVIAAGHALAVELIRKKNL